MGRKAQITKEVILETALQMLIRAGYDAITVKNLASEIGCSTQPIVWHFENMHGFRRAFLEYCIAQVKEQFTVWNGSLDNMLTETARGYITVACQTPHLFRFVFIDNKDECKNSEIVKALQLDNTPKLIEMLCSEYELTRQQAAAFLMNYEFYIHGIASYTASGFCNYSEEQIIRMAGQAKEAFLRVGKLDWL